MRDGSGVYFLPAGTDGIPNHSIESAKYNSVIHDIEADLNTPRPIVAGGTGANNALDARHAIGAEVSMVTVTNYDSQIWENGSFWSGTGATSAPTTAEAFSGIAVVANNDPNYVLLQVAGVTSGTTYTRQKVSGTWGPWVLGNELLNTKVDKAGDTMTGALHISDATASSSPTTGALTVVGGVGIQGVVYVDNTINANNDIYVSQSKTGNPTKGAYRFGSSASQYLYFDGAKYTLNGGALTVTDITASTSLSTGALTVAGGVGVGGAGNFGSTVTTKDSFQVFTPVGTPARSWFNVSGQAYWSAGQAADGTFRIINESSGLAKLTIDTAAGNVTVLSNTASTSPTTGALTVAGGLGVSGAGNFGGSVTTSNGFNVFTPVGAPAKSTFNVSGQIYWSAGQATDGTFRIINENVGLAKLTIDTAAGNVVVASNNVSSSPTTGALTVTGGIGIGGDIYANGIVNVGTAPTAATHAATKAYVDSKTGTTAVLMLPEMAALGASTTTYFKLAGGALGGNATESTQQTPMARAGLFKNLRIRNPAAAQPSSGALIVTLMVNGVASALTVTIPANGAINTWSNLVDTVLVGAGLPVSWKIQNAATATAAVVTGMVELGPDPGPAL